MDPRYHTELVKNCSIPMSDGVTLAADLYRPLVDHGVPVLVSFYPYHKDDYIGPGYFQGPLRIMAQAGYACLLVDIRGTGNSGGCTVAPQGERERRDYYEVVEWGAAQRWCDGNVGVWGLSYGSMAALLAAAENPPHLGAVAAFHGAGDMRDSWLLVGGRLNLLQFVADWGASMVGRNFMPPGYRDPEGRWLSTWRQHLESNVPWLITVLDQASSEGAQSESYSLTLGRIRTPVYLWTSWRDIFCKAVIEAYRSISAPKKLVVGPWGHLMPDAGHTGRIDYLYELRRWFDHWLRRRDTGIMHEPSVSIWVQGAETWVHEEDFPPRDVERHVFYLGPEGSLSESEPVLHAAGTDLIEYDATVGASADFWEPMGLGLGVRLDQRSDEFKGVVYTTRPLESDLEICGIPEAVIHYVSTGGESLLAVKLCDVAPEGASTLITPGWLDVTFGGRWVSAWGEVSKSGTMAHLNLIPTCYLVKAGHRLRAFLAGSDFPGLLPSRDPGRISIHWGNDHASSVRVPVRSHRGVARRPRFVPPQERSQVIARPQTWSIEQDLVGKRLTVRIERFQSLTVDGGAGQATITYKHRCCATASQGQLRQCGACADTEACWEGENEKIELHSSVVFRPVAIEVGVSISLNGLLYWQKHWSGKWPLWGQQR